MDKSLPRFSWLPVFAALAIVAAAASAILLAMGQALLCACGTIRFGVSMKVKRVWAAIFGLP